MTLAEAAAALGIPGPTLAAFENGSMRVSAGLLIMMGRLYGFTHVELFRSLL